MNYNGKIIRETLEIIKMKSDKNVQRYHFKFDEELSGLAISPIIIEEHSIIPNVGDTISFDYDFILEHAYTTVSDYETVCHEFGKELSTNWKKLYGNDILSYFFPRQDGELIKDYKNRIYNFILKNYEHEWYEDDSTDKTIRLNKLKPTSGEYKMSTYIKSILYNISYDIVKVHHCYGGWFGNDGKYIITDVYLIGKKKKEIIWG